MSRRAIKRERGYAKKANARSSSKASASGAAVTFGLLLVAGTLALYSPVRTHDFINYDDHEYVVDNPHVTSGLAWQTITWSLTSREQSNWHPLTWWSHALDYELFGPDAGDHHLTSVVIHALNAALLFLLLLRAGGRVAPSFVVAALFAWHPFNVQSVAWVAERKNLLSAFFCFLTLGAYGWYASQPRFKRFAVVAGVFVLALASKPMAVTLPFALLLLDYWPLQRIAGWIEPSSRLAIPQESIRRLLIEKLPLLALSAASSVVTVWAQRTGGWRSLQAFPLGARLENALYSYLIYLWKTFWPSAFALFYPHPGLFLPAWKPVLAAVLLCAISIAVWAQRRTHPYLIVGWLWFLGTLFPTIGVVQVGDQAMADRYAYLPVVGLFVIGVWGAVDLFDHWHAPKWARWVSATTVLVILGFITFQQLAYWEDSVAIWSHTLEVTSRNALAEKKLALALAARGDNEQAIAHFLEAENLDPNDITDHVTLGVLYASQGRLPDGMHEFQKVVRLTDGKELTTEDRKLRCSALLDLGFSYAASKEYAEALTSFRSANQSEPDLLDQTVQTLNRSLAARPSEGNYVKLSLLMRAKGKDQEALSILEEAIKADPGYSNAQDLLNFLNGPTGKAERPI